MNLSEVRERLQWRGGRGVCCVCGAASLSLLDQRTHIYVKAHCGCDWTSAVANYGIAPGDLQNTGVPSLRHSSGLNRAGSPLPRCSARDFLSTRRGALERWRRAKPLKGRSHPYLKQKVVNAHGLRMLGATLLVPMRDVRQRLWSLQRILPDGGKRVLPGPRPPGCYHRIGKPFGPVLIAEGYSTGAALHEYTGLCVVVAFGVSNVATVTRTLRRRTSSPLVICTDNDPAGVSAASSIERIPNTVSLLPKKQGHDWHDQLRCHGSFDLQTRLTDLIGDTPSSNPATSQQAFSGPKESKCPNTMKTL